MTKSEATKLAKVINYFTTGFQGKVWEAETHICFGKEWKVEVRVKSTAFTHEVNALMMVVSNTKFTSTKQVADDEGEIIWEIW